MSQGRSRETYADLAARVDAQARELGRLSRQIEAMSAITTTAMSTLDLQRMLDAVLAEIVATLDASAASVLLLTGDKLVASASVGLEEEVATRFSLGVGEGFGGMVAAERRPLYSPQVTEDIRIRSPYLAQHGMRTLMGVPLTRGDELVGVLRVGWAAEHEYDEHEVELVQLAADRFALAIVNARLYSAQAEIADTLQSAMLMMPDEVPGVEFAHLYRSSTLGVRVGGDFFDIFELPGRRVCIVIGDVSGHGLHTAAFAAVARNTVKAYALEYDSPARIMNRANDVVYNETASDVFVTAFVGILDTETDRLVYANAGHPSPFACGQDGCRLRFAEPQTLLGAFGGTTYADSETRLAEDETMLLYTDGALEARGESGGFFGDDRLHEALSRVVGEPVDAIPEAILGELLSFTGGRLDDDLALVAVRPMTDR
jgi:phosphoserine phosphatase RsbU/P